ncbi:MULTISPECIES: hypothetical protein [Chryseobacterium]|uniref:Magnesium-transporting ATPase (P-type) n=2 Tax=Chryseobacterium TaxID=59732 RepID=A0AAE3Y6T4_9FLAO|nr:MULTISPECIES: hypothetical protein [Chryseobacterium]MBL3546738.1 hypothetical protein [Chryseobacterium sp. KMC2]MDR6524706.1 magnesium-transporting ATPase (P-type) [Chryseobacterium rhizosphaerae]SMC31825.1 hypothetical protein SAMN02787074_0240 [Chryseobacterium sp. YR221]
MEERSTFEEFDTKNTFISRRSLLPVWIKIFLWFFLIGGVVAAIILLAGFFMNHATLSLYGINANHPYSMTGLLICLLLIYKGIVAYGLWFEQKWAPQAAIIDAIAGIAICSIMMFIIPFTIPNISFTLRLELIPLYFYLVKMQQIRKTWENL